MSMQTNEVESITVPDEPSADEDPAKIVDM